MTQPQVLLACGAASSLWYVAINVLVPLRWPEYSVLHQTVSEPSAVGAPTRPLWVAIVVPHVLLHRREVLAAGGGTLSDTLHLVWAGVTTVLFLLTMALSAAALPGRLRYTVLAMLLLVLFGALTSLAAPGVASNLPTPWIGVWERINIGVFLAWVAAFALLLRRHARVPDSSIPDRPYSVNARADRA